MTTTTPQAFRKHVVLLGSTNAGKSTLFNALTGQETSIVSPTPGTTTDPVRTAMELLPYGPIMLLDTAGLHDDSALGAARGAKTDAARRRADAVLWVADAAAFDEAAYRAFCAEDHPHLLVLNATPATDEETLAALRAAWPEALVFRPGDEACLAALRAKLAALLAAQTPDDESILGGLLPPASVVVLVVPVDSEAPKGRLILPQVQVIRDCLDNGFTCHVTRDTELAATLALLPRCDLVVTDSQAFATVQKIVPEALPLTSFSLLLARQKGDFAQLLAGARALGRLGEGARVLMLEGCTHNTTHEDIGRVKIPALLRKKTGHSFRYSYRSGYDFPAELGGYDLAIQCGSCMINKREVTSRLQALAAAGVPVSNYGMVLAWAGGILERSCAVFNSKA